MIYGLYLSATGIISNSYRQDVIANNLANSETVGFKRDMPMFQERLTAAQEQRGAHSSDPLLEHLGGGLLVAPTAVDASPGEMEHTGNALDTAIQGSGFYAVDDHGKQRLTRDGQFMVDRNGNLIMANTGLNVLGPNGQPIHVIPTAPVSITADGSILQRDGTDSKEKVTGQVGLFDVPDPTKLTKVGSNLLSYPDTAQLTAGKGTIRSENLEHSNVDPTMEMANLMDAQRQLEANANMIRYQDSTLQLLCDQVGKIS